MIYSMKELACFPYLIQVSCHMKALILEELNKEPSIGVILYYTFAHKPSF